MKKILFILLLPSILLAKNIPEFSHKDPIVYQEFENVYQQINKNNTTINTASGTISNLNVSSITWAGSGYTQRYQRFVNVKDFGAVGNGTTSDTIPIERALAAGPNVYFPGSLPTTVYLTTSSIKLRGGQTIFGDSPDLTVIQGDNLTSPVVTTLNEGTSRSFLTIRDMRIDNKSSSTVGGIGIRFSTVSHSMIQNVYVSRVSTGIFFIGNANFYNKLIGVNIDEFGTGIIQDEGSNDQTLYSVRLNNGNTAIRGAGIMNVYSPSIEGMSGDCVNIRAGGRYNFYGPRYDVCVNAISIDIGADYTTVYEPQIESVSTSYSGDTTKLLVYDEGQIRFPSTQNPSTNVNTLDDYEEGTWTPGVGGNATYTLQSGHYVKIGKLVYLNGQMEIGTIGTGSATTITGAPFVNVSTTVTGGSMAYWASLATNVLMITPRMNGSSNQISFSAQTAAGTTATDAPSIFGNGARVDFSITYKVTD